MTTAASLRTIEIARIDVTGRLRGVNPAAVAAYAEERARGSEPPAIKVVERGDGFKLINGLQRIEAELTIGATIIVADVRPESEFPTDADVRRAEIIDNFMRHELTKLDRAVHLAAWREVYDVQQPVRGRGRPKISQELRNNDPAAFVARFSLAAAQFLGISERSVQIAIQVAQGIPADVRTRIALTGIAQSLSDLVELSRQDAARQHAILDILLAGEPAARSVVEAIAILDKVQIVTLAGWQRISDRFSRLAPADRRAFFAAHEADVLLWIAEREAAAVRRAAAKKVA